MSAIETLNLEERLTAAVRAGGVYPILRSLLDDPFGLGSYQKLQSVHETLSASDHRPVVSSHELVILERALDDLGSAYSQGTDELSRDLLDRVRDALALERQACTARERRFKAPGGTDRLGACAVPLKAPTPLDREYATVWLLQVTATLGTGEVRYLERIPEAVGAALFVAFHRGCSAALNVLKAELDDATPELQNRAKKLDLSGEFLQLIAPVDGDSLGLGAALSAYAALTGLPTPDRVAATGKVDLNSRVSEAGSLTEKYEACLGAGISKLLVWKDAGTPASLDDSRCRLHEVATVRDAIDLVWPGRVAANLVSERWGTAAAARAEQPAPWDNSREYVVVLSVIMFSDPVGFPSMRELQTGVKEVIAEPGCTLTLQAECRPEMMACIYTDTKSLRVAFDKTRELLTPPHVSPADRNQPILPFAIAAVELPDPSHPQQVMAVFRQRIAQIITEAKERAEQAGKPLRIVANVSGGTAQMQYALTRLSLHFPDARWTLVQVRRTSDTKDGERRVRIVSVPLEID